MRKNGAIEGSTCYSSGRREIKLTRYIYTYIFIWDKKKNYFYKIYLKVVGDGEKCLWVMAGFKMLFLVSGGDTWDKK